MLATACCRNNTPTTSDPHATAETQALYASLFNVARQGTMFGHQDDTVYGHLWWGGEGQRSDILETCGDYPAIFGWDLGHIESGSDRNIDDVPFARMREEIIAAFARGAANTISWHMLNPATGGSAWDSARTDTVKSILSGEGEASRQFRHNLDAAAEFLLSLTLDGTPVPVLFRPWHEHTGSGFWWGSAQCSPEEYKALWQFTASYLRDVKGVHNLLYVYSPDIIPDTETYFERYPGDEWVDVLGLDAYHRPDEWEWHSGCQRMLSILTEAAKIHNKPAAFTETGLEGITQHDWWTRSLLPAIEGKELSWVLVWRNACAQKENKPSHYFAPWHGEDSEQDFVDFIRNDRLKIFTLESLPQLYTTEQKPQKK
ncbi:MAG: beta-mannosidase [Alistipes sp.]|nr:beta-mannosidase [Alistipes sp.]